MTKKVWPWQGPETDALTQKYCPRTGTDLPDHAELAQRLADRRDAIVAQFELTRWAEQHPDKAYKAYAEVFASVLGLTNIVIPPPDWGTRDDSGRSHGPSPGQAGDLVEQYGIKDAIPLSRHRAVEQRIGEAMSSKARQRERVMERPDALQRRVGLLIEQATRLRQDPQVAQYIAAMRQYRELTTPGSGAAMSLTERADRVAALTQELQRLDGPTLAQRQELDHLLATIRQVQAQADHANQVRQAYLDQELGSSDGDL
jgi:hypothetical protein